MAASPANSSEARGDLVSMAASCILAAAGASPIHVPSQLDGLKREPEQRIVLDNCGTALPFRRLNWLTWADNPNHLYGMIKWRRTTKRSPLFSRWSSWPIRKNMVPNGLRTEDEGSCTTLTSEISTRVAGSRHSGRMGKWL